jgi:hypothetical protein
MSLKKLTLAVGLVLLFAVVTNADTIHVTRQSGSGDSVSVQAPSPVGLKTGIRGGPFTWDVTEYDNANYLTIGDYVLSFCIDLKQTVGNKYDQVYDLGSAPKPIFSDTDDPNGAYPMGDTKALRLRELWAENIGDVVADINSGSKFKANAFQVSIWEIVFEDLANALNVDPNNGDFYWNWVSNHDEADSRRAANNMLGNVDGSIPEADLPSLFAWSAPSGDVTNGFQDQVVEWVSSEAPPPVPEPSSVVALAGLGLAFAAIQYRRKRKAA